MEKREASYTVGGNVNGCNHHGEQLWRFLLKLNTELPQDPAIPLLAHPDKTVIQKDICTPMFIAALFTIARHGNKCPLTDEWIKMW